MSKTNGTLEVEPDLSLIARFLSKAKSTKDRSGCWIWTAAQDEAGYPQFSYNGKTVGARRFALALFRGLVHGNKHVRATENCKHGKLCINPAHTKEKV